LPHWLPASDLDTYVAAFERGGFRGGLNYCRNLDRNWQLQSSLNGMRVQVPALIAIGSRDVGLSMPGMDRMIDEMPQLVNDLRGSVIEGAGHWVQQERRDVVNELILSFAGNFGGHF
jgi:pimeloyl-ACP methyl ester carboxylesterase